VSVSKVAEADLRVATSGAPVTLGSVRALRVELDTTAPAAGAADGAASSGARPDTSGSVTVRFDGGFAVGGVG
jgi:hypothetical protein